MAAVAAEQSFIAVKRQTVPDPNLDVQVPWMQPFNGPRRHYYDGAQPPPLAAYHDLMVRWYGSTSQPVVKTGSDGTLREFGRRH